MPGKGTQGCPLLKEKAGTQMCLPFLSYSTNRAGAARKGWPLVPGGPNAAVRLGMMPFFLRVFLLLNIPSK